jgi:hypothetical protein
MGISGHEHLVLPGLGILEEGIRVLVPFLGWRERNLVVLMDVCYVKWV